MKQLGHDKPVSDLLRDRSIAWGIDIEGIYIVREELQRRDISCCPLSEP